MVQTLDALELLFFARVNRPFIALIAVDPHIIITAINQNIHSALTGTELTGHHYLKNIINLPFYLHNGAFRQLQQNLVKHRENIESWKQRYQRQDTVASNFSLAPLNGQLSDRFGSSRKSVISATSPTNRPYANTQMSAMSVASGAQAMDSAALGHSIVSDDYFSNINPRSMRRIINTLNLTGRLMRAFEIKFTWQQLSQWISLVEQWPYRVSFLVDACEINDDVPDNLPLHQVYDNIKQRIPTQRSVDVHVDMDRNAQNFEHHLRSGVAGDTCLTVGHLRTFVPCSANLDPYIKKLIRERRLERNEQQLFEGEEGIKAITMQNQETASAESAKTAALLFNDPTILTTVQAPLANLSVDQVCHLVSHLAMPPDRQQKYRTTIETENISGLVLSMCELDELKSVLKMPIGDWTLFKMLVEFLRAGGHFGCVVEKKGKEEPLLLAVKKQSIRQVKRTSLQPSALEGQRHRSNTTEANGKKLSFSRLTDGMSSQPASQPSSVSGRLRRLQPQATTRLSITPQRQETLMPSKDSAQYDADAHQAWLASQFSELDTVVHDGDLDLVGGDLADMIADGSENITETSEGGDDEDDSQDERIVVQTNHVDTQLYNVEQPIDVTKEDDSQEAEDGSTSPNVSSASLRSNVDVEEDIDRLMMEIDDPEQITRDQIKLAEIGRQTTVESSTASAGRTSRRPSLTYRPSARTAGEDNEVDGDKKTVVFHLNEDKK